MAVLTSGSLTVAALNTFLSGFQTLLVIGLIEIVQADPGETHHRWSLTLLPSFSDSVLRIPVRVIVPGGHMNYRPGG